MTRLKEPETMAPETAAAETEAPVEDNPLATEPPKLKGIHEKTKEVVARAMTKDAKQFDELARAQTSGQ